MQLSSLSLHGFKSFGDRINIEFDKGVTGIVGPNGSGKSNIVDGLRWVTGGGRASQYRAGDKTELIFHGADGKRSVSYAEVELELTKGKERINISRNLFRDGNSTLRLNGKLCRLSDIEEVLSGTGLGKSGLAIVGQGEVGQVLTADPEKLLDYVAEAIDVARLSSRREQTQQRLLDTLANLQRLEDIMRELEKHLEQLREEAELAENHTRLNRDLLMLRFSLSCQREEALDKEVTQLKMQDALLTEKLSQIRFDRKQSEDLWQHSRRKAAELENVYREALTAAEAQKAEYRIAQERLEALRQQEDAYKREQAMLDSEIDFISHSEVPQAPQVDIAGLSAEKYKIEGLLQGLIHALAELEQEQVSLETQTKVLRLKTSQETEMQLRYQNSYASLKLQEKQLQERLVELHNQKPEDSLKLRNEVAELERSYQEGIAELETLKEKLGQALQEQAKLHAEARALARAAEQNRNAFEARRGYASGPKLALSSGIPGVLGSVADIIRVEDDYRLAIATALGRRAEYVITDNADTAQAVIRFVKQAGGWLTTLPLDLITAKAPKLSSEVQSFSGIMGLACDYVEVEDRYLQLIYQLLGNTTVIASMPDAVLLAKRLSQRPRLVSLDGGIMESYGAMSGGQSKTTISVIGAAQELEASEAEARKAFVVLESHNTFTTALQNETKAKQDKLTEQKQLLEQDRRLLTTIERQADSYISVKKELDLQLKQVQEELLQLKAPVASQLHLQVEQSEAALASTLSRLKQKQEEKAKLLERLRDYSEHITVANERQKSYEEARLRFLGNQERLKELQTSLALVLSKQKALELSLLQAEEALSLAEANLPKDLALHQEAYAHSLKESQALEQRLSDFSDIQAETAEALEAVKIALARREAALELAVEERKAFPLGLERSLLSNRACRERLATVESELEAIGPVNHRAAQDLASHKERYEDLQIQSVQVTLAVAELEAVLNKIDQEVTSKLSAAVQNLKLQFQHYVRELFGADAKANILVHEEDHRPKGLSIILQPPGKQTQSLNLLSVGERTMGAMAFLFSLLHGQEDKRLPIAILDEVDAPLDEANIRRYCTFLDHLAKQGTQFVLITHQKATFDVANVLWGISSEKGVSRVFSISRSEYEVA